MSTVWVALIRPFPVTMTLLGCILLALLLIIALLVAYIRGMYRNK